MGARTRVTRRPSHLSMIQSTSPEIFFSSSAARGWAGAAREGTQVNRWAEREGTRLITPEASPPPSLLQVGRLAEPLWLLDHPLFFLLLWSFSSSLSLFGSAAAASSSNYGRMWAPWNVSLPISSLTLFSESGSYK